MALGRVFSLGDPSACQAVFPADVELFPTAKGNFHARDHASRHEPDLDASNPHSAARD
jgi:hypothetical protein